MSLAWLLARTTVASPIASARTPGQVQDLLPAATLDLGDDEPAAINAASEPLPRG